MQEYHFHLRWNSQSRTRLKGVSVTCYDALMQRLRFNKKYPLEKERDRERDNAMQKRREQIVRDLQCSFFFMLKNNLPRSSDAYFLFIYCVHSTFATHFVARSHLSHCVRVCGGLFFIISFNYVSSSLRLSLAIATHTAEKTTTKSDC